MKRIGILGACLSALLAIGAFVPKAHFAPVGTASAQAETVAECEEKNADPLIKEAEEKEAEAATEIKEAELLEAAATSAEKQSAQRITEAEEVGRTGAERTRLLEESAEFSKFAKEKRDKAAARRQKAAELQNEAAAKRAKANEERLKCQGVKFRWFVFGAQSEEGVEVPYVAWGKLSLTNSNGGSPVECQNEVAGYVENPEGGGSGKAVTQAWTAYNCTNSECEAAGGKIGVIFENEATPGQADRLEWPGELTEAVAGTIRLNSTNVRVYTHCQFLALSPTEKAGEGSFAGLEEKTSSEYNAPGADVCTTAAPGSSSPKVTSGSSTAKPSKLEFSGGAGGELECGAAGKGTTKGKLKIQGYNESEVLTAKKT